MKKLRFMLLAAAALLTVTTIQAQVPAKKAKPAAQQQHTTPEQLAAMRARHIAADLAFDDEVSRKFIETYCQYHKELRDLRLDGTRVRSEERQSEEAIRESILAQFDQSRKILDLREKYYKEYSSFLTQRQIRRVYTLEGEVNRQLNKSRIQNQGRIQSRIQSRNQGQKPVRNPSQN